MSRVIVSPGRELAALLTGIGFFVTTFFGLTAYTGAGMASTRSDKSPLGSHLILLVASLAGALTYRLAGGRELAARRPRAVRPPVPPSPLWDRDLDG